MYTFNLPDTLNYGFPQCETEMYQYDPHKTERGSYSSNDESTPPQRLDLDPKRKGISEIINGLCESSTVFIVPNWSS